jgi:hypothetical protein
MTAEPLNPIKLRVSPNRANAILPISLAAQAFPVAVERTAERLPIPCLTTVCRAPHTPLCVAQHRCCARLEARATLAGYSKQPTQRGAGSRKRAS